MLLVIFNRVFLGRSRDFSRVRSGGGDYSRRYVLGNSPLAYV